MKPEKGNVIKRLQCRGAEPDQASAPLDSSGGARLPGRARSGLVLPRDVRRQRGVLPRGPVRSTTSGRARIPINNSLLQPFLLFHLSSRARCCWSCGWPCGSRALGQGALHAMDAFGTIAALGSALCDGRQHAAARGGPRARDADGHDGAALSAPPSSRARRGARPGSRRWPSCPIPFVAYVVHRTTPELSAGGRGGQLACSGDCSPCCCRRSSRT